MNQNQQLKDAIQNLKNENDAAQAWIIWLYVCYLLGLIMPGFICPYANQPGQPSVEDLHATAAEMEALYCVPDGPPSSPGG